MSPPRRQRTPSTVLAGRYELIDRIGTGGMGTVWRARDARTGGLVAAKLLGPHDSGTLLRFVREQGLRIRHPHVLTPSGWAADDHRVVLGMDLVRGGTVAELLAETGPLPPSYAALLLDQLLQALAVVHDAGVVHRDVKPANLLLDPTGDGPPFLRLGDFGVAVPLHDVRLTHGPAVVGTDGYLAPEQRDRSVPDPAQDVYAAGVVATQLLTGRPPRPGRPLLVPEGPLRPLVGALLDPDPTLRPTAAAALGRLRRIDVPRDGPWPVVPDRLPPPPPAAEWAATVAIGCFVAAIALCGAALAMLLLG
ncbi:serine/threonine-protein kinase [Nocardioides soli]|uniref:non-specific serine/threonine protein kinase n=1 Tax=Nocardioides soli TaxID=1036020 RepID=A0A7W4W1F5_9ACTN|nr:serine/threonine-protein kinase [Nocardioides soli]MBB3045713.1 serine/threonine-protein kinase [Nocardioides soli]